jgi:hypothetical protein
MADNYWEQFYSDVGIKPTATASGVQFPTLSSQFDPQQAAAYNATYKPATTRAPTTSAPGSGLSLAQMFAMRDPGYDSSRETWSPAQRFSAVRDMGPELRLLPGSNGYGNAAVAAAAAAARPGYKWPSMPFGPGGFRPGADPGDTGLFGHKKSSGIPEQVPPPGLAPTKWAGGSQSSSSAAPQASTLATTFPGSSTGRTYNVGQQYRGTNGYIYEARPDGTFRQVGRDPSYQPTATNRNFTGSLTTRPLTSFERSTYINAQQQADGYARQSTIGQ